MSYIADVTQPGTTLPGRSRPGALASSLNIELRSHAGSPDDWLGLVPLIRESSGVVLPNSVFLSFPEVTQEVHAGIAAGKRVYMEVGQNDLARHDEFLGQYGLITTTLGPHASATRHRSLRRGESPS